MKHLVTRRRLWQRLMGWQVAALVLVALAACYPVARWAYWRGCDGEMRAEVMRAVAGLPPLPAVDTPPGAAVQAIRAYFGTGVFDVAVRRSDGAVLAGRASVFQDDPVLTPVLLAPVLLAPGMPAPGMPAPGMPAPHTPVSSRGMALEAGVVPTGGWAAYHARRQPLFDLAYTLAGGGLLLVSLLLAYGQYLLSVLVFRRTHALVVAQAEADRRADELNQANARLLLSSIVFRHAGEAIMVTDGDNRILNVNPAFEQVTGYRAEEVIGQTPKLLSSGRHGPEFYREMWQALDATGSWSGEIWNRRCNGDIYPEWLRLTAVRDDAGRAHHYIAMFSDISERKALEARMSHLVLHDPLTGLPNRLLMMERLRNAIARAKREGRQVALLMLDLDRFKLVNDAFGHTTGDALLLAVADRLGNALAPGDALCRLGGDEFAIVLADQSDLGHCLRLAASMGQLGRATLMVEGHELTVTTSVGIGVFPRDAEDAESLVKNADAALYAAKDLGRNTFRFYTEEISSQAQLRQRIETELRQAIDRDQFELYLQPQVDCGSGELTGAEALIRWHHPERGMIPPADFIPVLEETDLILPVGRWVIDAAAAMAARLGDVPIAINVSPLQLRRGDIVADIRAAIARHAIAPAMLEVEITESVLMADAARHVRILDDLKRLGVRLAIDDFGTGYSSLSYLGRYNVDVIKIDQSFVRGLGDSGTELEIITAIISLAHALNLRVIAEGVETDEQRDRLKVLGCDLLQGYRYGRPMPEAEFRRLVQGQGRRPLGGGDGPVTAADQA